LHKLKNEQKAQRINIFHIGDYIFHDTIEIYTDTLDTSSTPLE